MFVRNILGAAVAAAMLCAFAASGVAQADTLKLAFVFCKADPTLLVQKPAFRKECKVVPDQKDPDCNVCPVGFIAVQDFAPGAIVIPPGSST